MRWPDFTIGGRCQRHHLLWEHLGLLSDPAYAQRWRRNGRPTLRKACDRFESANGADRVLIETTEAEGTGLNMLEIERLARIVLG